jgi:redox-sensing transcriptional repressor
METKKVSNNMLARMPVYLNYIKTLPESTKNISATKIASALGLGEVSVRKDLAKVSDGGRCKLGYPCKELIHDIETFLGIKKSLDAVAAGKTDLLQMLLTFEGFENVGLNVLAAFDINASESGSMGEKPIYPMEKLKSFCKEKDVSIGIIMSTVEDAQEICDQLVESGVEGIWNFTPVHLKVPDHVVLQNESFTASITKLRMQLNEKKAVS